VRSLAKEKGFRTVSMSEDPSPKSLENLKAQIDRLKAENKPREARRATDMPASGMGVAFAIASHLVAGLIGGAAIGYFLDAWLDTGPWFLVVFFFLGSAAGMLNVYRMVSGMGMALGYRPAPSGKEGMRRPGTNPAGGGNKEEGGKKRGESA
jgi:ATP synthase protein I